MVGTKTGTATDLDGRFSINVPSSNSQLNITYIGMTPVAVKAENGLVVAMNSNSTDLDEVVFVAYGTAKKSELTGAVSQVTSQQIEARPVTSVTSALEGTTTGLQVNSTYGQPGDEPSIRIRGFASINGSNSRVTPTTPNQTKAVAYASAFLLLLHEAATKPGEGQSHAVGYKL